MSQIMKAFFGIFLIMFMTVTSSGILSGFMTVVEAQNLHAQIINELDDLDKALLIIYADEGSMAKAGKKFNVSAATIYTNIKRIRQVIKEKL